jgi:hypothetical protein
MIHFGPDIEAVLRRLNATGPLFPYLTSVRSGDRATEFKQRCEGLGIKGVTLHSYRYAWAERAKTCGYPERFAQEALGHNSKAVHRSYSRKAKVRLPPGELRTAGGGRPNHSVAPVPTQARNEWSLDFSGWLSVQFPGIVIAVCAREKNLKRFFTLQTLDENGVEAENQPSRPA